MPWRMASVTPKRDLVVCPECKNPTHIHTAILYDTGDARRIVMQHKCVTCGHKWSYGKAKA